jgi:hypothetical protein
MPNLKNSIIFLGIAVVIILGYVFFFKKDSAPVPNLTTSGVINSTSGASQTATSGVAGSEFLTLLLNVKNIKLNDSIFADPAFTSLVDSSITLNPDGTEGRPNPFAPIGSDTAVSSGTQSVTDSSKAQANTDSTATSTKTSSSKTTPKN